MAKLGRNAISGPLLEMFHRKIGQTIYVADLAQELKFTEAQIRSAIAGIRRNPREITVEPVIPGLAYVGRPVVRSTTPPPPTAVARPAEASQSLFRQIGTRQNGALVLERDDGVLYEATEL